MNPLAPPGDKDDDGMDVDDRRDGPHAPGAGSNDAKAAASDAGGNDYSASFPTATATATCLTCGAAGPDCEEDVDNPGDHYCARCWEEYAEAVGATSSAPSTRQDGIAAVPRDDNNEEEEEEEDKEEEATRASDAASSYAAAATQLWTQPRTQEGGDDGGGVPTAAAQEPPLAATSRGRGHEGTTTETAIATAAMDGEEMHDCRDDDAGDGDNREHSYEGEDDGEDEGGAQFDSSFIEAIVTTKTTIAADLNSVRNIMLSGLTAPEHAPAEDEEGGSRDLSYPGKATTPSPPEKIIDKEGSECTKSTSIDDIDSGELKTTTTTTTPKTYEEKLNKAAVGYAEPAAAKDNINSPDDCDPNIVMGANEESQDHADGITEDTVVPTGSDGWSVYDGETQMLPTAPSQAMPPAASSSANDSYKCQDLAMNDHTSSLVASVVDEEARTSQLIDEQTDAKFADDNDGCIIKERGVDCDHEILSPSHDIMKQTPENCSTLPISYPMDHILGEGNASPSQKEKTSCLLASVDENVEKIGDVGEEEKSQLSQDLLLTSPPAAAAKSDNCCGSPTKPLQYDDPIKTKQFSASKDDRTSTNDAPQTINEDGYANLKIIKTASLSRQEKSGEERTEWISSARHVLHEKVDKDTNSFSSPRLLMPSFRPIQKSSKDEVDDGSDEESWSRHGNNCFGYDSIESSQDESEMKEQPSAFKRLSRGTLKSANDKRTSPQSEGKPKATSVDGVVIQPKVLRYERKDSSSEAEFSHGDDNASDNLQQHKTYQRILKQPSDGDVNALVDLQESQTDERIREQLREVHAILPMTKEMQNIASRNKQLSDEIAKLKTSYKASIMKLNQEKTKLVAQLKTAQDTIRQNEKSMLVAQLKTAHDAIAQKDQIIKEKNALLKEQFDVIARMKGAYQSSDSSKKRTPHSPKNTSKKQKKKLSGFDSDSGGEEDDEVPLSALKNKTPSLDKKNPGKSCSSIKARKAGTKLISNAAVCSDEASIETALLNNRLNIASSKSGSVTSKYSSSKLSNVDWWKTLQERGWKYVCGPEPHNKVYVPKDGATHAGTQLGIHFFDIDNVRAAAIARGDLPETFTKSGIDPENGEDEQFMDDSNRRRHVDPRSDEHSPSQQLLDRRACGNFTFASVQRVIDILDEFMREDDHDLFARSLFAPLWDCLKTQGADVAGNDLTWRQERFREKLAICNWCYVPPSSIGVQEGRLGTDYFLTGEQLVLYVLKEISTLKELSSLYADNADLIQGILPVLERAVDENLEYRHAKIGKSSSVRSRRASSTLQASDSTPPKPTSKSDAKGKTPKKTGQQCSVSSKKRKITPESKMGSGKAKRKKTVDPVEKETSSPSFHSSQTQGVVSALPSYSSRSPGQNSGPLSGFKFFHSGIDSNFLIDEKIKRLGGEIVNHTSLTLSSARSKVFFLSDYTCWRKLKYIYANSLGTPMLHFQWLVDLEKKFKDYGVAKPFDSELYTKYRLPLGLDLSRGYFTLQRASAARCWDPPGRTKGEGSTIFDGMTIVLAVDEKQQADWKMILNACGATVLFDIPQGKGRAIVDCCLLASTTLPPHVISVPDYVTKLRQRIDINVPLLDLAWAHQSIIQRKRLPFEDARYMISLDPAMNNVSSIKNKSNDRYEVGDLVEFRRGAALTSFGRIKGIARLSQVNGFSLDIQVMESQGVNLVDCPSSAQMNVEEKNLRGNIVLLDSKDFHKLGYLPNNSSQTNIFNRVVDESQMSVINICVLRKVAASSPLEQLGDDLHIQSDEYQRDAEPLPRVEHVPEFVNAKQYGEELPRGGDGRANERAEVMYGEEDEDLTEGRRQVEL
ncbi:hypothetical protein ACHAW5_006902 [Stephanodiscus triporus]|uniref:BRCT domain-containing protein n=1 Tax=Stephanodiscus triporus TaxID=2934178 RepID=A0ABD3NMU6_9STRA